MVTGRDGVPAPGRRFRPGSAGVAGDGVIVWGPFCQRHIFHAMDELEEIRDV